MSAAWRLPMDKITDLAPLALYDTAMFIDDSGCGPHVALLLREESAHTHAFASPAHSAYAHWHRLRIARVLLPSRAGQ